MFSSAIYSLTNAMISIKSMLASLFPTPKDIEVKALTQATKLEAAYTTVKKNRDVGKHKLSFMKVDQIAIDSVAQTLPDLVEYINWYCGLLVSGEGVKHSDVRGKPDKITLSEFMTQNGYYVSSDYVEKFYEAAEVLLDLLINHKDQQVGKESYYIRVLGNTLVTIKNVSDAFAKCSTAPTTE